MNPTFPSSSFSSVVFGRGSAWAAGALALAALGGSRVAAQNPSSVERFVAPSNALVEQEDRHWRRTPLPVPASIVLEVSGILPVPGERLLVCTRRGEIWWVDGAYDDVPQPRYTLFAAGLHEPLGLAAAPGGGVYVAQRHEITRIEDVDGDGRADMFRTVYRLPISGNYHEYAFGPVLAPNGNLRVVLNVSFGAPMQSSVPWRGWMLEITPEGRMTPIAAGLRSPADLLLTSKGLWLYSENQGEWVGSGRVTEVQSGDFLGHPASLAWSHLPGSPVKLGPDDVIGDGEPMHRVAGRMPGLKTPTIWLPHTVFGISNAGLAEDATGGLFGPFAGQLFVGDQGQSKIMRLSLEQVRGVWQGAAYAFREGFESGVLRIRVGERGRMFVGETARGWGSVGPKQQGLERLHWTGVMPFEIQEITAKPDGFLLRFTRPVDRATAEQASSYALASFTYKYHGVYGSAPVERLACPVRKIEVAADGLSVRLAVACLREGYVHEIKATGVKSRDGAEAVLHPAAYYTLNRIPAGPRIIPIDPADREWCQQAAPTAAPVDSPKRPAVAPADWRNREGDRQILLGTLPGLKFDRELITAKAGEKLLLAFRNDDDMLHNFVLCAPGRGQTVGTAALALGVEGAVKGYVPESADVLYHTSLVAPGSTDRIFFVVPATPGDYDYICSFPGHSQLMKGVLRVTAP